MFALLFHVVFNDGTVSREADSASGMVTGRSPGGRKKA